MAFKKKKKAGSGGSTDESVNTLSPAERQSLGYFETVGGVQRRGGAKRR